MKAVILAGGKGTRLGEISKTIPKPMVKIGEYPILEHQIRLLARYGITEIILVINYLPEIIKAYFQDGTKWGVRIDYFVESEPLGTTGGIKAIEAQLTDDFMVIYGDIMLDINLNRLIQFHQAKKSSATLVLHPNDHPYDSDLVEIDPENRITHFHSKPHDPKFYYRNLVNAGVYILSPGILKWIELGKAADFGKHIFPKIVNQEALFGYISTEYMKDSGTPDRLNEVTEAYTSGKIARLNSESKRKAIFLDRDGVINKEVGLISDPDQLELLPCVETAIKLINQSEYLAIVITNQPVIAKNLCSFEVLQTIHNKMETLLGKEGAKLDAIFYCPHHPDSGFPGENSAYKINCDCRKPKIGLILQAVEAFNIDVTQSYMIGDTERDIVCGKQAGVKTIAVKTGHPIELIKIEPDHISNDLLSAVQFILKEN